MPCSCRKKASCLRLEMMLSIKDLWRREIHQALGKKAPPLTHIQINTHKMMGLGHYSSPILLELAANLKQAPMTLGVKIKSKIPSCVALTAPGFLNFCCQPAHLWQWLLVLKFEAINSLQLQTDDIYYQQKRLDLLLSPFDLAQASLNDCLELGDAEYRLGLLLMEAIDSCMNCKYLLQEKSVLLLVKGIDDYFNRMVFLSQRQSIFRARHYLLRLISDFLFIITHQ
ncbi:MAG: hypothetical protein EBY16_02765 [Gammaproteobacteria bacterium]|nr:hypothetical protein [Gammaproteobacteria bacterium]